MKARATMLLGAALLVAAPSLAADNDKVCAAHRTDGYTPDQIIEACSNVIMNADYPNIKAGA